MAFYRRRKKRGGGFFLLLGLSSIASSLGTRDGLQHHERIEDGLIIDDDANRFPYFVQFPCNDGQRRNCGGSLIAPDLVLTSSHCRGICDRVKVVGLNQPSLENQFNTFEILEEFVHPRLDDNIIEQGNEPPESMLVRIKLNTTNGSTPPILALNRNPSHMSSMHGESLSVLKANQTSPRKGRHAQHHQGGLGMKSKRSYASSLPQGMILPDETVVQHVPNVVCSLNGVQLPSFSQNKTSLRNTKVARSLSPRSSDDMLCVAGRGQCDEKTRGDFGGGWPVILKGNSYHDDIQVGISLSRHNADCNSLKSTRYYHGLTASMEWIKRTTCAVSSHPPSEFNCLSRLPKNSGGNSRRLVDVSTGQTTSRSNHLPVDARDNCFNDDYLATVTLLILFDSFPEQTSWHIDNLSTNGVVIDRPSGFYRRGTHATEELIRLCSGDTYEFVIGDTAGDGMCCMIPGTYSLQQEGDPNYLVFGGAFFGYSSSSTFLVSGATRPPTEAPSSAPTSRFIPIMVIFVFDQNAHEIGWSLTEVSSNALVDEVSVGTYRPNELVAIEEVIVERGATYSFTVVDSGGNGLCCEPEPGTYLVALDNLILTNGWADFGASETSSFTIPN